MMDVKPEAKRLELLRELVPTSALITMLVNPRNAQAETQSQETQKAARVIGQQVLILSASTERELETVFAAVVKERASALLVGAAPGHSCRRSQIVENVVIFNPVYRESPYGDGSEHSRRSGRL